LHAAFQNVRTLNLAFTTVGDDGLAALAQHSPNLVRLTLGVRNYNIFDSVAYSGGGRGLRGAWLMVLLQ